MTVKPAIRWLNTDSDILVIKNISVVLKAMADNVAIYPDPNPPLADIRLALDNFSAAVRTVGRSPADTVNKNSLRKVLTSQVRLLASYVTVACKGSMANLILSGFPPQKGKGQPVGIPTQPQGLVVKHGEHLGELRARINQVLGSVIYNYRLTANTPGAVPVVEQDTACTHTFRNLVAGVKYTIDVNAAGTAGTSDWSIPVSLTAD
jgi:hypothetical protein